MAKSSSRSLLPPPEFQRFRYGIAFLMGFEENVLSQFLKIVAVICAYDLM